VPSDSVDELREQLEAATRELAALSYSVSHDLRAPLRTIEGFSEALADEYRDKLDEQGLEYLGRIRGAAARMDALINGLVDLAGVSRSHMQRELVKLSALGESIAEQLRTSDSSRKVHFSIEPGLVVNGDARLLRIAFEHLLGNAWKFTGKRPEANIEVGSDTRDGRRVIHVRDDGVGFNPAHTGRMFGAFQRFHRASDFDGIGIGLAMVQRIVHRHGGKVSATGKVDEGATVYIELP
jgi:light-regulated signal transduction histidine kinase (bacteriophytochrome)